MIHDIYETLSEKDKKRADELLEAQTKEFDNWNK